MKLYIAVDKDKTTWLWGETPNWSKSGREWLPTGSASVPEEARRLFPDLPRFNPLQGKELSLLKAKLDLEDWPRPGEFLEYNTNPKVKAYWIYGP